MSNKKKHLILSKLLAKFQEGEERTGHGIAVTELGRSMTNIQLHHQTGISIENIDKWCYVLSNQGHLTILQKDEGNKAHRYLITPSGQQAVTDKFYLNQVWFRQRAFWFSLLPIIISLVALFWTIVQDAKKQSEIDKLKTDIQNLQKKVK